MYQEENNLFISILENVMKTLNKIIQAFWLEESGLTMTEYAVAGSLVTIAAAGVFTLLGGGITRAINGIIALLPVAS